MWSMYVDMGVNNAFSLFRSIADGHGAKKLEFKEFKRRISESLVTPFVNSRRKRRAPIALDVDSPPPVCGDGQILVTPSRIECAIGNICSVHVLTENKGIDGKAGRQLRCFVCHALSGKIKYTIYGCTCCLRGFHVRV